MSVFKRRLFLQPPKDPARPGRNQMGSSGSDLPPVRISVRTGRNRNSRSRAGRPCHYDRSHDLPSLQGLSQGVVRILRPLSVLTRVHPWLVHFGLRYAALSSFVVTE
jgi:hypothetical protein